jgi:hypothetical protein
MLSAGGPFCNGDRVSDEAGAGRLEAGGLCCNGDRVSDEVRAGRLEAGGRGVPFLRLPAFSPWVRRVVLISRHLEP